MSKETVIKHYSNGTVKVQWEPSKCIHSQICFKGLPGVFDPRKRPWVNIEGASSDAIMEQVSGCPSGALSYSLEKDNTQIPEVATEQLVEVMPNGPILVYGNITLKLKDGTEQKDSKVTAFCRCGHSHNKPYCDGTHRKIDFKD